MRSQFHFHARQYHEEARESLAKKIGKVVSYVRANPLCTTEEIKKATGISPMVAISMLKQVKYGNPPVRCWRINKEKCG